MTQHARVLTDDYFDKIKYIFDMSKQLSDIAEKIGEHELAIILGLARDFRQIIKDIRDYS